MLPEIEPYGGLMTIGTMVAAAAAIVVAAEWPPTIAYFVIPMGLELA